MTSTDDLLRDLAELGARYRARYATAIFEIRRRLSGRDVVLTGEVLLPAQRAAVANLARRHPGLRVRCELQALATRAGTSYASAGDAIVDVFDSARPGANLVTQVTADDPAFELLAERSGRYLVRLDDRTLGWVDAERTARPRRLPFPATTGDLHDVLDEALSYRGVPYLTGGCTRRAIDCSALIQRVFRSVRGRVLPRHTRDQLRVGEPVARARARAGDVVFLVGPRGVHTGMLLQDTRVLHASYRRQRIAIDTLAELRQSLRLVAIRRYAGSAG